MRRGPVLDFFAQEQLVAFEPLHLFFKRPHDRWDRGLDDPLDRLFDLLFDGGEARLERLRLGGHVELFALPKLLEHGGSDVEHRRLRFGGFQDRLKLALDDAAADRFTVARAALLRALIVGVPLLRGAAADGPAGRERPLAIVTQHEAAEWEVLAEIGAVCDAQAVEPVLDTLEGLVRDQRFMMALASLDAPARRFDIARIDWVAEDVADTLVGNLAVLRLGIERVLFEEAHHVRLGFQLARGVGFERLLDDRRLRLLAHEYPAIEAGDAAIGVAGRRAEHREAVLDPRAHSVDRLLGIVDAVIVREGHSNVFGQTRR